VRSIRNDRWAVEARPGLSSRQRWAVTPVQLGNLSTRPKPTGRNPQKAGAETNVVVVVVVAVVVVVVAVVLFV
jgi:hypothetical protein